MATMIDLGFEPPIEPPEPKVVCICSGCDRGIYEGEEALRIPGWGWYCDECASRREIVEAQA